MPIIFEAEWFWGRFYSRQNLLKTIAQLDQCVAVYGLKRYVKEICAQQIPGTLRTIGGVSHEDFYLYVGIADSPAEGHLPHPVSIRPPFANAQFVCVPTREVVRAFNDWRLRTEGKVLYRAPEVIFDLEFDADGGLTTHRTPNQVLTDTQQYDRLLLWMSAQGSGDYRRFRDICKSLFPDQPDLKSTQIRKHLRLLGHIAESPDGMHWRALPPLLVPVRTNEQTITFTLVGARDSKLKVELSNAAQRDNGNFYEVPQLQGDGPSAWFVDTTVPEEVAKTCGVGLCNNYADCVEQLPDIDSYRRSLAQATVSDHHYYDFRLFDGQVFQSQPFIGATGMYEIWTLPDQTPTVKRERTLFFDKKDDCWRSGDWYGLRYLHHQDRETSSGLLYQKDREELLCPEAYRLPERYEQALVIASGKLPDQQESGGTRKRVFFSVPQQIAEIVARKVGANLVVN
jgi:hypothetical protein